MKKALRNIAASVLTQLARPIYGGIGCIVCLHRVLPEVERSRLPGNRALEITPDDLRALLSWSARRGLEPVSMDDVPLRLKQPRGGKFIAFTFDDGYRDNLTHALPVFREAGVPFTVNVTTGFVSAAQPVWWYGVERIVTSREMLEIRWRNRALAFALRTTAEQDYALDQIGACVRAMGAGDRDEWLQKLWIDTGIDPAALTRGLLMDWNELRILAADPLVTIGAHSVGHHDLSQLSEEEARAELADSKCELETQLGRPIRHVAFPFGGENAVREREFRLAHECGFETAVTTRSANLFPSHSEYLNALPRLGVSGNYDAVARFEKLESGVLTALTQRGRRVAVR